MSRSNWEKGHLELLEGRHISLETLLLYGVRPAQRTFGLEVPIYDESGLEVGFELLTTSDHSLAQAPPEGWYAPLPDVIHHCFREARMSGPRSDWESATDMILALSLIEEGRLIRVWYPGWLAEPALATGGLEEEDMR